MKAKRILRWLIGSIFGLASLSMLLAILTNPRPTPIIPAILMVLVPLLIGAVPVGILEAQVRSVEQAGEVCRRNIEAVAGALFDVPGRVREGYDLTVTNPATGDVVSRLDTDKGYTTDGTFGGARVSVASHASMIGRQVGEMFHTYSHVLVDVLGMQKQLSVRHEGVGARVGRAMGVVDDATVGDETFDATFVVDADEELARAVFDDDVRRKLLELEGKVSFVSSKIGAGGMSLVLTKHGLALRWPGDMTPELARFVRDLLLDMRAKILAHESRKAARVDGAQTGYRIAEDPNAAAAPANGDRDQQAQAEAEAEEEVATSVGGVERRA